MSRVFGDIDKIWILVVPIVLVAIYWYGRRSRRAILREFIGDKLLGRMVVHESPARRWWKAALRIAGVALCAVAVLRPQWGTKDIEVTARGIDIVFCIDTSKSMLAEDVQPNRLERVKQDVRYFVDRVVEQDRIGLAAFAGTARVFCPLTLDRAAFDLFLDELDVTSISKGGTNVRAALEEAVFAFGDDERNHKAIVLFSDGEGHDGVPEKILEEARRRSIRVYTVGIGSTDGERIPIRDAEGNKTWLKDTDGDIVTTRLDDRLLKTIAQKSLDGAYTHLAGGRRNLERIYQDNLSKIEQRELKSRKAVRRLDRYQWFLAPGLILLLLSGVIQDGTRTRVQVETKSEENRDAA